MSVTNSTQELLQEKRVHVITIPIEDLSNLVPIMEKFAQRDFLSLRVPWDKEKEKLDPNRDLDKIKDTITRYGFSFNQIGYIQGEKKFFYFSAGKTLPKTITAVVYMLYSHQSVQDAVVRNLGQQMLAWSFRFSQVV